MSEQQIKEPGVSYASTATEVEEHGVERAQEMRRVQFPPYFERFLEERDRRLDSELAHLASEIRHNRKEIGLLRREMERRFAEAREERGLSLAEAREERQLLRQDILRLEKRMEAHLRWTLSLLFPIILGVLAIVFKTFFGTP